MHRQVPPRRLTFVFPIELQVSLVHDAGHTPFAGVTTACSNDGEVLALNWLSRHADRLLVGSCDVAGEIGTGLIQIMRVVPDGSNLRLDASNGQLNEMSWLNSICSNSTDDYFIAAGLNQVRLFDLETSKLCRESSSSIVASLSGLMRF